MIDFKKVPDSNIVEITIDGRLSREQMKDVTARLGAMIEMHGKIRVIEVIRSFGGMDPMSFWDDIRFSIGHYNDFERCAVVADEPWIEWWTKAVRPLLPCEVRLFGLDEIDEAREWTMADAD